MGDHYRVLVVSGGGIRGLVQAKILHKISTTANRNITDLFDCIIGTSIGGITATALTVPSGETDVNGKKIPKFTTTDGVNLFMNEAKTIFPPNSIGNWPVIGKMYNTIFPKYSREGIDSVLEAKLGNATLSDTVIPVVTVSYSLDGDGPRLWSTHDARINGKNDHYLKDAAGATSAAPTYFPPKVTEKDGVHRHDVDGGIFANSAALTGLAGCRGAPVDLDKIIIVSIGTGKFADDPIMHQNSWDGTSYITSVSTIATLPMCSAALWLHSPLLGVMCAATIAISGYQISSNYGQIGWVASHDLIGRMMKGSEIADDITAASLLGSIRINPSLDREFASMDDTTDQHLARFSQAIDRFIATQDGANIWNSLVECLDSKDAKAEACHNLRVQSLGFNDVFRHSEYEQEVSGDRDKGGDE